MEYLSWNDGHLQESYGKSQTLPPRKMKTLFKKYINFEERHGTEEDMFNKWL
mgnify:CR=1 FL=1